MLVGTSNRRSAEMMWWASIGSILCRSACSSSSPQFRVSVNRRSRTICRSESSTMPRASNSRIVHSGPNDWSGNGLVMMPCAARSSWTASFSLPAVRKVPSTSMSSGKRMSNVFSMSRSKATAVIESRPSCTSYVVVDGVRLRRTEVSAQALLELSGYVVHIFIAGSHPGIHFTGQVQSVRRNFEAIPADTEAEPPQTARTALSLGCVGLFVCAKPTPAHHGQSMALHRRV